MAEHLTTLFARVAPRAALLMLHAAAIPAFAGTLVDPTLPPAILSQGAPSTGQAQPVPSGPVLQSVLISPNRVVAIINGQTVKPGDRYGDARVVRIAEGEVVLQNGSEQRTLKLFPDIEKLPATRHAGATPGLPRNTHN